ncbi:MAG: glycosyltransferase [Magnetococcales bacterium]|nr:glycosyltransferase [Magnetococcales bacterium]
MMQESCRGQGDGALPRVLFISPRFLFPTDTGGQIRTAQVLRHAHGRWLDITLLSPATLQQQQEHAGDLSTICSRLIPYRTRWQHSTMRALGRAMSLLSAWPVSVASDRASHLKQCLRRLMQEGRWQAVVYDFTHMAINYDPPPKGVPALLFTHNVEQEIFKRRAEVARGRFSEMLWRNQYRKMQRFEDSVLGCFETILAVSERDAAFFQRLAPERTIRVIPTGVDTDQIAYQPPGSEPVAVFVGSMDAHQNIEGVGWFLEEIWPLVKQRTPEAQLRVIGRYPPEGFRQRYAADSSVTFTGWVEDPALESRVGALFIVPLRVGGGTRIKIYEAMAMGLPVVSTQVGAEGLALKPGKHYLQGNDPEAFSQRISILFEDRNRTLALSREARTLVERKFGWRHAARAFAEACLQRG